MKRYTVASCASHLGLPGPDVVRVLFGQFFVKDPWQMGGISTRVTLQGPFDLALSLDAAARFLPPRRLGANRLEGGGSF